MLDGAGLVLGPGFRTELDHWEGSRGEVMAGRTGKVEDLGLCSLKEEEMEGLQVLKLMKSCQAKEGCLLHGQVEQPKTKGLKLLQEGFRESFPRMRIMKCWSKLAGLTLKSPLLGFF